MVWALYRPILHNRAKFREDLPIRCCDIAIFVVFQDGGRRHLGFWKIRNFNEMSPVGKNVSFFSLFLVTLFIFPRDFSGTIEDTDTINTPLEPLRPADVPFGGFVDIALHFVGEIPPKRQTGKILKVSCYRNYYIGLNQI